MNTYLNVLNKYYTRVGCIKKSKITNEDIALLLSNE
jgi:hypothetical protein